MLLVNARAGVSRIHGIGLIAQEFIPKGTKIWALQSGFDLIFTAAQLRSLSPTAQSQVLHYAYFDQATQVYVFSGDDDRFTNHSENPNTQTEDDQVYAARDIQAGEEITWDYRTWGGEQFVQHLGEIERSDSSTRRSSAQR